jgi:hypothetical protein
MFRREKRTPRRAWMLVAPQLPYLRQILVRLQKQSLRVRMLDLLLCQGHCRTRAVWQKKLVGNPFVGHRLDSWSWLC